MSNEIQLPDCGDNSCFFNQYRKDKPTGMRTNGGCHCKDFEIKRAFHVQNLRLKELEGALKSTTN